VDKFIANKEIINKMAARNMDYNSSAGSREIARVEKAMCNGRGINKYLQNGHKNIKNPLISRFVILAVKYKI